MKILIEVTVGFALLFPLVGCAGSGGASRSEQVVSTLKQAMPEDQARAEVQKFEQNLAKKSPQFNREQAWKDYHAEAQDRAKQLMAKKESDAKKLQAAEAKFDGAAKRWGKWVSSGAAKGHLLDQLLKMRNLGRKRVEKIVESKFDGKDLYLETKDGVRIIAVDLSRNSSEPLTGFHLTLKNGEKFEKSTALQRLGLPSSEFRPVSVSWHKDGFYWRWKKLAKALGYDEDLGGDGDRISVFWQGP